MVHAHPVDRRVESFEVGRALQSEDQRRYVRVHVPDRTARAEPSRVAERAGELHAAEEVLADVVVELLLEALLDDVMRHKHGGPSRL